MSNTINTSNRISGLASGIDTDELVKSMTLVTQSKITKAEQTKQQLLWKQEQYREITTQMTSFYDTYFNSSTGITSSNFFNATSATSSSSYLSVSADSSATMGTLKVSDIVSVATASSTTGVSGVSVPNTISVDLSKLSSLGGKSMSVTINGQAKTITFTDKIYGSVEDVRVELDQLISNAFGLDTVSVTADADSITLDNTGGTIQIADTGVVGEEISSVLGFTSGQSNRLSTTTAISAQNFGAIGTAFKFTINGTNFEFSETDTLAQVMGKVNASGAGIKMSYSSINDKFTMTSTETGSGDNITFSDTEGSLMSTLFGAGVFTEGKNAEIMVSTDGTNYERVVRRTNSFDVAGVTINILGQADGTTAENINISVTNDTDAVVEKVKKFAEAYNTLLTTLRTELTEERDNDYLPLTDDQKEDMSEAEIKQWETKAKGGLLRGDTILQSAYSSLRSSIFTDVKVVGDPTTSIGVVLSQIGITTGSYFDGDYGTMKIDDDKLAMALTNTPEKVTQLFTQKSSVAYSTELTSAQRTTRSSESGIAWRLSDILNDNVRKTRDSNSRKGSLLEAAGLETDTTRLTNALFKKIQSVESLIDKLNDRLTDEEDRYYAQFTSMEQAIQSMNDKSSYLSNMFGSSNS